MHEVCEIDQAVRVLYVAGSGVQPIGIAVTVEMLEDPRRAHGLRRALRVAGVVAAGEAVRNGCPRRRDSGCLCKDRSAVQATAERLAGPRGPGQPQADRTLPETLRLVDEPVDWAGWSCGKVRPTPVSTEGGASLVDGD